MLEEDLQENLIGKHTDQDYLVDKFLTKPIQDTELINAIQTLLSSVKISSNIAEGLLSEVIEEDEEASDVE